MEQWMKITEAAKFLGVSLNGVRIIIYRERFKTRQIVGKKRTFTQVSRESCENYRQLILEGKRRDNYKRKKSEGTGRKYKDRLGYVKVNMPQHPRAMSDGYIYEHWLVMEKSIGRHLTKEETVHHKNHVRDDNRIENLHLYASRSEHLKMAHSSPMKEILLAALRE